jgi:hypothetical protein
VVELSGSLTGDGLLPVTQLLGELHRTGTLHLTRGAATSRLAFDDGRLVGAECGDEHGLQAVAHCAVDFAGAEFQFVEGAPTTNRTLDLGPSDLTKLLTRLGVGDFPLRSKLDEAPSRAESACPLLGFADDRDHHYSRSTALHRCFATGAPNLVSPQEQRDLCLSGRFAACPRFRNNEAIPLATTAEAQPTPLPVPLRVVPAMSDPTPMPPAVATRVAAASQMHISTEADLPPAEAEKAGSRRGGLLYIAAGVVAGLVVLALVGLFALPAVRGSLAQRPAPAAISADATPVPTSVAVADARATPGPTSFVAADPTSVPVSRVAASSPQPAAPLPTMGAVTAVTPPTPATAPAADADSLIDARFASGPVNRWLQNAPYAGWGDGAYRLQARDLMRFVAVGVPIDKALDDVIVSATFRKTGGPPGGGYGLIVRDQGPEPRDGVNQELSAYVLEVGDLGEYGVWRRDGDHWVDLVPWTRSAAVRSGGSPNELLVRAVGDQLSFSVNGTVIAVVTDDTYPQGGVGLFVGGDYNDVALDRFDLQLAN